MIYQFIKKYCSEFPVKKMCQVLRVARSGYYRWLSRRPGKREQENQALLKEIRLIHKESMSTYGSPRITAALREKGYVCSRPRIARIMQRHGISAKTKRKFKITTQSKHNYPVSPNIVNQNFTVEYPNIIWVSDITYIRTKQGWLYLTIIMDLFNREIVGWSMGNRLTTVSTTIPALKQAYRRKSPNPGLIFHSDQGIQYASEEFRKYLRTYKMVQSMSKKGNCYDNAVAESFFHTLKTEHVYFERYQFRQEAKQSIFEYIEIFYNRKRKHSALGYKTPVDFLGLKKVA